MKLLVLCVPYDAGRSGVSVYIDNVVRELDAAGHDLTLIVEKNSVASFPGKKLIVLPGYCRFPLLSMLYCLYILPFRIRPRDYERILITAGNRRFPAWGGGEVYAVVHDLSQFHIPRKYDYFRMFYVKKFLPFYLRRKARHLFAVSRSTADDMVRYWRIPKGKISVNYNGIDRSRLSVNGNDAAQKVVFYVSRIEVPGKNHANLIRAWEKLPPEILVEYKLILVGSDWPGAEAVHAMAAASPCCDSIEFTGFATKEKLRDLYDHASLYVFPSFFEGFGLSLVEAMTSGIPCCCSNNSSLGEIAGDAALTFDPNDPDDIRRTIAEAIQNKALRADLRERGLRRAEEFRWELHAAKLLAPCEDTAEVFGVTFSTGTMQEAMGNIERMVKEVGRRHFCAFVNADCLNQAYVNPAYRELLQKADAVWADGIGVAMGAKFFHTPVRENVNGTDMLPLLCRKGFRMFLLGAGPGVAEKARENLTRDFPEAQIVGVNDGFFGMDVAPLLAKINALSPDILLVAMGCPKQEFWIVENLEKLDCRVAIGVGGLFDFASGRIPRAPMWMRRVKIEWTYRLYNEPRRLFRRYVLGNPLFLFRVFCSRFRRK